MDSNELRIGNYVTTLSSGEIKLPTMITEKIGNIGFFGVQLYDYKKPFAEQLVPPGTPIENLSPIPLTEEWLVDFGWVWNKECDSYEKYPNGDARMNLTFHDVNNSYTMFNYVIKANICSRLFYVHQLQNLYFALTNKELIMK